MGVECPKYQSENPDTQGFYGEHRTQIIPKKETSITEIFETLTEELTRGVHRDLKKNCIMINKGRNNTNRRREDA